MVRVELAWRLVLRNSWWGETWPHQNELFFLCARGWETLIVPERVMVLLAFLRKYPRGCLNPLVDWIIEETVGREPVPPHLAKKMAWIATDVSQEDYEAGALEEQGREDWVREIEVLLVTQRWIDDYPNRLARSERYARDWAATSLKSPKGGEIAPEVNDADYTAGTLATEEPEEWEIGVEVPPKRKRERKRRSRFLGVTLYRRTGRWRARIQVEGATIDLGYFISELDAAYAYDQAALKFFGKDAVVNDPALKVAWQRSGPGLGEAGT